MNTRTRLTLIAALVAGAFTAPVFAQQSMQTDTQRNVDQQQRIEQGLQSGQLNTKEASQLESGQAHIDKMEAHAAQTGNTPAEQARIQAAQNRQSQSIYNDKHNGVTGNPNSASSQRMQADVQRNVNQQSRINQGVRSGSLTPGETASLERGQSRVNRAESRAGADGHVGPNEQRNIQGRENNQSNRIYNKKHNGKTAA